MSSRHFVSEHHRASSFFYLGVLGILGALGATEPLKLDVAQPTTQPAVRIVETPLYRIPDGVKVADTLTSPDSHHLGCVERREKRFNVVIDGSPGPQHDWIVGSSLCFSPDSRRFAYQTQHDGLMYVACGITPPFSETARGPQTRATCSAAEGKGFYMVGRTFFSPDGQRYAYGAQAERGGKMVLVVDGSEQPEMFDDLLGGDALFSRDGKRIAYRARREGKQLFVVDGKDHAGYDAVAGGIFSPDGARFAYRAKTGESSSVVIDGKPGPAFDMVTDVVFSADGRRSIYAAGKSGKQMLVVDHQPYKPYEALGDIAISPDGRRIALTAKVAGRWILILDGKESTSYEATGPLAFSADSKRLLMIAGAGRRQFVIVDGEKGPTFDAVGNVTFSPDGNRVAYVAVNAEQRAFVVDGKQSPIFVRSPLFAFSPDGRHVVHLAPRSPDQLCIAVDGAESSAAFEGIPAGGRIVFDSPTRAHTIAGRGTEMFRVDIHIDRDDDRVE